MTPQETTQLAEAIGLALEVSAFASFVAGFGGYLVARQLASVIRWQYRVHRFKRHSASRRGIEAARTATRLLSSPVPAWLRSDIDVTHSVVEHIEVSGDSRK